MNDIFSMFSAATKAQSYGVEGYYVENKYFDARRSREQKTLELSRDKSGSINSKPSGKRPSYLDLIIKEASHKPGPTTYQPNRVSPKQLSSKGQSPRRTIFDEMAAAEKKRNYPAAGKYDKVEVGTDKKKFKGNISKAEVVTYIEGSMRSSIECPGVGAYDTGVEPGRKGPKWVRSKEKSKSERTMKLPAVGTYNPLPMEYQLFEKVKGGKKSKSYFSREERFKAEKSKTIPYYNVLSEWGIGEKLKKKDILSRIGSSLNHHSVYH